MTQNLAVFLLIFGVLNGLPRTASALGEISRIWEKSIPFYLTQESNFPSGEAAVQDLEKRTIKTEWDLRFDIEWDKKNFVVNEDQLAFDLQFVKEGTINKTFRFQGKEVKADQKVKILKISGVWCNVKTEAEEMWVPLQFISPINEDLGGFKTYKNISLKQNPDYKSKSLTEIPAKSEFIITQWKNDWLQVRWNNQNGFIHSQDLLGRPDFAEWAFVRDRGWVKVKFRVGSELLTDKQEKISLSLIRGYKPYGKRAIVTEASPATPPLKSIVDVTGRRMDRWNLSFHDVHGPVWWKSRKATSLQNDVLSFDDLVKRKIFSFDYQVSPSTQGLISADGIFASVDGKSWQKISTFGDQNYPVAIHNGTYYVGSFKSTDAGKTFEPYIQWEMLFSSLQKTLHRQPPLLRLVDIKPKKDLIEIKVDTGIRRVKLQSVASSQNWNVVN